MRWRSYVRFVKESIVELCSFLKVIRETQEDRLACWMVIRTFDLPYLITFETEQSVESNSASHIKVPAR